MSASPAPAPGPLPDRRVLRVGTVSGLLYGLLFRLAFGTDRFGDLFGVMTFAFIFLVPLALGYVTVAIGERDRRWSWPARLFVPMITALTTLAAALLLAWEGLICIALWLPLFLVLALLGGLLAGVVATIGVTRRARGTVACLIAALPLLVSPAELARSPASEVRTVRSSIDIRAEPATIWHAIATVRRFEADEHRFSWAHLIGFPRPVAATLDGESVGGVRHATFEGGVVFEERITVWDPPHRLAFSIHADPDSIPMRTLDPHVTVGGEFFDVLDGEYRLEPLPAGGIRLHLASRHRLSTRFNFYSALWTDFVMGDIQRYILARLATRCERGEP